MRYFVAGVLAAAAALGYLSWSSYGDGTGDDGDYRWYRFDVGTHLLEVHVGRRA